MLLLIPSSDILTHPKNKSTYTLSQSSLSCGYKRNLLTQNLKIYTDDIDAAVIQVLYVL